MAQREFWGEDGGMMSAVPSQKATQTAARQALMDSLPTPPTPTALLQWAEGKSFDFTNDCDCVLFVKNGVLFYRDEEETFEFSSFLVELQNETLEVGDFNLAKVVRDKMA